jgi:hypothetical protein
MPSFYKIRHIPSGLFFKPSRHHSKTNLSKKGKIYGRKPTLKYLGKLYHHPISDEEFKAKLVNLSPNAPWYHRVNTGYESRHVIQAEWEIVEYKVEET